jgi:transposase-like protein
MKLHKSQFKEKVVSDYLSGGGTYRQLQDRYGVDFRLIFSWVKAYKEKGSKAFKDYNRVILKRNSKLPEEVKKLQDQLRQSNLHNKLLESLIDICKEKYGIDLRKKNGTKQS